MQVVDLDADISFDECVIGGQLFLVGDVRNIDGLIEAIERIDDTNENSLRIGWAKVGRLVIPLFNDKEPNWLESTQQELGEFGALLYNKLQGG